MTDQRKDPEQPPALTFTGTEIGYIAGMIARCLPELDGDDYEVADLLLERAIAAFPGDLSPSLKAHVDHLRTIPLDRFWRRLNCAFLGFRFNINGAAIIGKCTAERAGQMLAELVASKPNLRQISDVEWALVSAE